MSTEPMFDAFTGKPLKSDPGAEAQFNSHTGSEPASGVVVDAPPLAPPPFVPEPWDAMSEPPPSVIGSDVPPFGSPVPENNPPAKVDTSISSEVETLIRETHTMVTEVHAFVAQLLEQVPTLVAAVESSPLGGMLGGLFCKK